MKSISYLQFPRSEDAEYQVIAEWQFPAGGEGMIIAIGPDYSRDQLRTFGSILRKRLAGLDKTVVMIFDDANAARQVRRGSRIVGEAKFQEALLHQRAMYLKSRPQREDSFTIYKAYPTIDEVIRFDENESRGATG